MFYIYTAQPAIYIGDTTDTEHNKDIFHAK